MNESRDNWGIESHNRWINEWESRQLRNWVSQPLDQWMRVETIEELSLTAVGSMNESRDNWGIESHNRWINEWESRQLRNRVSQPLDQWMRVETIEELSLTTVGSMNESRDNWGIESHNRWINEWESRRLLWDIWDGHPRLYVYNIPHPWEDAYSPSRPNRLIVISIIISII
jgi:hypothetical protein